MDLKAELLKERERLSAYGLTLAVSLIDAEIERLDARANAKATDEAPVDRKTPAKQTTAASRPLKSAANG